jgi:hypothetical protein
LSRKVAVVGIAAVVLTASACGGGGTSPYSAGKTTDCLLKKYGIHASLHNGGWVAQAPSGYVRLTFASNHHAAELFNDTERAAIQDLPLAERKIEKSGVRQNVQLEWRFVNAKDLAAVEGCLR